MKRVIICLAAIVWTVTSSFSGTPKGVPSTGDRVVESGPRLQSTQVNSNALRIAVTPKAYDDIGSVLKSMGWKYTEIQLNQLSDYELLSQKFDAIFINCPFSSSAREAKDSLEQFVRGGGTLYASDLASEYIDTSFPGHIHFYDHPGDVGAQTIHADVVDPGLISALNTSTLTLNFNWTAWVPVASVTEDVKVYLSGDFTIKGSIPAGNSPLTVSFAYGTGRVVYTAFHNNEQISDQEKKLLSYLVLISATEKLSSALQKSLAGLGYGIQEEILGSISAGGSSPRYKFTNSSAANLAVGLNWQAGKLKLSVFKPDGSQYKQLEGPPPMIMEIPNAEAGDWSFQVNAVAVPYNNYPYVIQIGAPGVVAATPTVTSENPVGITQATPSGSTEKPAGNTSAQGNQDPVIYVIIGAILYLVLLFAAVLIAAVIFFQRKRKV